MDTLQDLKAGDSKTYDVAGEKLVLKPLPIGKLKNMIDVLSKPNKDDFGITIVDYLLVVFDKATHPFLNRKWIEENVTLPVYNSIIQDAAIVNGLPRFLNPEPEKPKEIRQLQETQQTPSGSVSSITPSASPTSGQ